MASAKLGVIIGIIILIAGIAIILSSSEINPDNSKEITQTDKPENIESEEYDYYINEEGRKVLVINTGDVLSIEE